MTSRHHEITLQINLSQLYSKDEVAELLKIVIDSGEATIRNNTEYYQDIFESVTVIRAVELDEEVR